MILISHRGNINGKNILLENTPNYIDAAILEGFDVEIDVWYKNNQLWLGHDNPDYNIDYKWFCDRITNLWIHCKNINSIEFFNNCKDKFNFFWHQTDTITLTSKKFIWAYPNKQPIKNSIAVLPELNNDDITFCDGICSDVIGRYKNER